MNYSRASPLLAAVLLLGCVALGYQVLRQRTEIVRVDLDLKVEDQAAQKRNAGLERQLAAALEAQLRAEKQAAQPAQNSAKSPASDGAVKVVHISDIIKEHPEYAEIQARQARRGIYQQYGAGFDSLNLQPAQVTKLKDLLVERNQTAADARQAAIAAGLEQGTPAYWAAIKQATDAVDQEMTTALGTDGGAIVQKLQAASGARNQIMYNYAPDFDEAGASLTTDQNRGLEQAISASRKLDGIAASARQGYFQSDPATGLSPSDNRLIEAAAQVLSPAQLQILKADQILSNKQSAIMQPYFAGATSGIRILP